MLMPGLSSEQFRASARPDHHQEWICQPPAPAMPHIVKVSEVRWQIKKSARPGHETGIRTIARLQR